MSLAEVLLTLLAAELLDGSARPANVRALASLPLRLLLSLSVLGVGLALTGNITLACLVVLGLAGFVCTASNLKYRVLGEPLVFSDFAVLGAIFRFPALYLYAVPWPARIGLACGLVGVAGGLAAGFVPHWRPHLAGLLLTALAGGALAASMRLNFLRAPALLADVARHGVPLTLLFYWRRWLNAPAIPAPSAVTQAAELLVIVQCESFADPTEILPDTPPLPALAQARAAAWAWGNLAVSGFGAYTMRAEYGVLCGVEEETLGFRRYDPFLTAAAQAAHALPAKLPRHRSMFLHPYDLRFFGRDRLMPALGFSEMLDAGAFAPPDAATGPYCGDLAMAARMEAMIKDATSPTLLYAVTMENHGPWGEGRIPGLPGGAATYLRHLAHGDAMLQRLMDALARTQGTAVLVFFGDHRPYLPGEVEPGTARHTPYVLLRYENGITMPGPGRADLAPAALHHVILESMKEGSGSFVEKKEPKKLLLVSNPAAETGTG